MNPNINISNGSAFLFADKVQVRDKSNYYNRTKYDTSSDLNSLFFSNDNINRVHIKIKDEVFRRTKVRIGDQDLTVLVTIMKGIYMEYSNFTLDKNKYNTEIDRLNNMTIKYSTNRICDELRYYLNYKRDISAPISSRTNPVHISRNKELEFRRF